MEARHFVSVLSRHRVAIAMASVVTLGILAAIWIGTILHNPRVILLLPKDGAQWLRVDSPFHLNAYFATNTVTEFRAILQLPQGWTGSELTVTALRRANISIDDQGIFDTGDNLDHWKTAYTVPLPKNLRAGTHRLNMKVTNASGPAMVRVSCNFVKPETWEATAEGTTWRPAVTASEPAEPDLQGAFDSTGNSLLKLWPWLLGFAVTGTFILLKVPMQLSASWASTGHRVILLMWVVVALRARATLPYFTGYDCQSQFGYVQYVALHHRIPQASEGWEFFQAPFYYLLSGGLLNLLHGVGVVSDIDAISWLRLIPLMSGLLLVEISFRTAQAVFPRRSDLQLVATVIAGFIPVNLYMSPTISNEPTAAAIAAIIPLMMMQIIVRPQLCTSRRLSVLGAVFGLACLTKITALLWFVPLELGAAFAMRRAGKSWLHTWQALAIVPLAACLISGWYFVHNFYTTGRFIAVQTAGAWWQDPGYRTPGMFLTFGHVFAGPAYTTLRSVWDCLYGTMWGDGMVSGMVSKEFFPPYNYGLMACGLCLAVMPMSLILMGVFRAVVPNRESAAGTGGIERAPLIFATVSIFIFIAAILHIYLMIPLYGWGKASYMLGTVPCLSILAAAGFDLVSRRRLLRAIVGGVLFSWAITAYLTFFTL